MMDLKEFLPNKEKRLLHIIEQALHNSILLSVEDVQSLNSCSRRTVYNDVEDLIALYGEFIVITFENNYLSLRKISYGEYQRVVRLIVGKSIDIKVAKYILFNPNLTPAMIARNTNTSDSYVYRIISKLKVVLKKFDITLSSGRISFVSKNEKNLDLFFRNCFFNHPRNPS